MHQITAFAGLAGKAPFQQAVLQSPGFQPVRSTSYRTAETKVRVATQQFPTRADLRYVPFFIERQHTSRSQEAQFERSYRGQCAASSWITIRSFLVRACGRWSLRTSSTRKAAFARLF